MLCVGLSKFGEGSHPVYKDDCRRQKKEIRDPQNVVVGLADGHGLHEGVLHASDYVARLLEAIHGLGLGGTHGGRGEGLLILRLEVLRL